MKKLKILLVGVILFSLTGCLKKDNFEDIDIYTTVYPIEYIVNYLYGDHSKIYSIYPDGVDTSKYELTKKQIKDYSSTNLYVFNGINEKENDYVTAMFKHNKHLKIIDAARSMEYIYSEEELWVDPSNFLMLALNIKNGILEYTTNHYLKNEVEEKYNKLKISISQIDAKLKLIYENSNNKTIVVDNDMFKFLEKYGFRVISLEENENLTAKTVLEVTNMIGQDKIDFIFTTNSGNLNDTVKKLVDTTDVQVLQVNTITNLTDEQRSNKDDYISLLNENIDLLKNELYD